MQNPNQILNEESRKQIQIQNQYQQQLVLTGGASNAIVSGSAQDLFMRAREKAHTLTTELNVAKKDYAKRLISILQELQTEFYKEHGKKMEELEDLEYGIETIQVKAMKSLERNLRALKMNSPHMAEDEIKRVAKELATQYKASYFPDDEYQRAKQKEATQLRSFYLQNEHRNDLHFDENVDDL